MPLPPPVCPCPCRLTPAPAPPHPGLVSAWCVVGSLTPSVSTPLNLAGGGGDFSRPGNRLTVASCDSLYKKPRCNSTASSIHSAAGYNTDMTVIDSVCLSPGVTGQ